MATIEQSMDVEVPIETAYNQWTQFEEFPQFMEGVESVTQLDDTHVRWIADIGGVKREWTAEIAPRFFAVYAAAFAERPGFPGVPAETWIDDVTDDEDFRPGWSVLAEVPGVGDAGFVVAAVGWIVQVGVLPAARGNGLGAALVREALGRMVADGAVEAWLDVNVNNAAIELYRRLGFQVEGRRGRYQPV